MLPLGALRPDVPAAMLLIVGGTTLIFVGSWMREKRVYRALILSPLCRREYLWS